MTLDGKANDFVQESDVSALKSFSYRYYSHTFPKTHGNPVEETVKSKKINPWPLYVVPSVLLLLMLIF